MKRGRHWMKSPFLRMFLLFLRITLIIRHFFRSGASFESHLSDSLAFFPRIASFFSFSYAFPRAQVTRKGEIGNDTRRRKRQKSKERVTGWGVNFIPANQGTGWSRSALSSAVDDEKKITKSTTIRFLDCQSSVPLVRSVKLISRNRYTWLSDILYSNAC